MAKKKQITELISTWESRRELADLIGAKVDTVHKWASSNSIPAPWQKAVVDAAQAKGLTHITSDWMLAAHAHGRRVAA